jgi:hypothetical protein
VRYTLLAPALSVQHCHCPQCRKGYGALTATGAVVERANIRIEGDSNLTTYLKSPGYLASDHASFVTGAIHVADGGMVVKI